MWYFLLIWTFGYVAGDNTVRTPNLLFPDKRPQKTLLKIVHFHDPHDDWDDYHEVYDEQGRLVQEYFYTPTADRGYCKVIAHMGPQGQVTHYEAVDVNSQTLISRWGAHTSADLDEATSVWIFRRRPLEYPGDAHFAVERHNNRVTRIEHFADPAHQTLICTYVYTYDSEGDLVRRHIKNAIHPESSEWITLYTYR